jgi:SOS response associated peptidase (SRAP)
MIVIGHSIQRSPAPFRSVLFRIRPCATTTNNTLAGLSTAPWCRRLNSAFRRSKRARPSGRRRHQDKRDGSGRAAGNVIELTQMNFSFPPSGRGGTVFNFRSEGRRFDKSNRCLISASAFFEFTGKKYPKAKHRFTLNGAPFLAIAGIWREGNDNVPPGVHDVSDVAWPDVESYHMRQVVVLRPDDWAARIYLTKSGKELLRSRPEGSLDAETVREGSD